MHTGKTLSLFCLAIQIAAFGESAKDRAQADALFNPPQLLHVKIDVGAEGLRSLKRQPRTYVPATIREGDEIYTNVLVRLRGSAGSFRPVNDKPGLTIKIEKGAHRFHGVKKFHLNNSMQDRTYLNEFVCNDIFRSAGVPALRVTWAIVELNGRDVGLYLLKESFNKDFLAQYFHNTKGNLYGQSGGADINRRLYRMSGKSENTYADLKALTSAAQDPDPTECWKRLQSVLDVDRFLSFMTLEVMLCHRDGYTFGTHNFRVYQDLDTGKMVFFPHDMDQMIGEANLPIMPQTGALVARAVLRSPEGRARYRERVGLLLTNVFQPDSLAARIDQCVSGVAPALREYDPTFAAQFQSGARNLKQRIRSRFAGVEKQLVPPKPLPFENNVGRIRTWRKFNRQANATLEEVSIDGRQLLRISCEEGGCNASWRSTVLLEPGQYRFSGRARLAGIVPRPDSPNSGVCLRIARSQRTDCSSGDTDWKLFQHEFSIDGNVTEIALVCELHAHKGEVFFDRDSLRLERLP